MMLKVFALRQFFHVQSHGTKQAYHSLPHTCTLLHTVLIILKVPIVAFWLLPTVPPAPTTLSPKIIFSHTFILTLACSANPTTNKNVHYHMLLACVLTHTFPFRHHTWQHISPLLVQQLIKLFSSRCRITHYIFHICNHTVHML